MSDLREFSRELVFLMRARAHWLMVTVMPSETATPAFLNIIAERHYPSVPVTDETMLKAHLMRAETTSGMVYVLVVGVPVSVVSHSQLMDALAEGSLNNMAPNIAEEPGVFNLIGTREQTLLLQNILIETAQALGNARAVDLDKKPLNSNTPPAPAPRPRPAGSYNKGGVLDA